MTRSRRDGYVVNVFTEDRSGNMVKTENEKEVTVEEYEELRKNKNIHVKIIRTIVSKWYMPDDVFYSNAVEVEAEAEQEE